MEDLIPLLIFIVIAAINFLKYVAEKSGRKPPARPEGKPVEQEPRTLEDFFEQIERKFKPQPREMPAWPEGVEPPDYVREMEEYEAAQVSAAPPAIEEAPLRPLPPVDRTPRPRNLGKVASFRIPSQGAVFSGLSHMHVFMQPLLRSGAGQTTFELGKREQLKQALIASMVFGQPRAYDRSFDTTLAK